MFKFIFAGISIGFDAFLKMLPIYNQLSGIKEQLIASVIGVPVIIVSIIFLIPTIIKIIKKIF